MAGDCVQHHHHNRRAHTGHHAHRKHQGVSECDYVEETVAASEDAEHGLVDEEEAPATGVQAEGSAVREAAMGSNERG